MGILTAEFPPTSGDATLAGFSVRNEPEKTRMRTGYCPQFDAHFTNLTGREHVELYASIKGIPKDMIVEASSHKLKEVGLSDEDSDRLCIGYSGGMKRRLSLACATIGQPQIVFLDECSTGVDPVARREIWEMISNMVTGENVPKEERTSVILTTHSMEECEALCPNIAIMAGGKLRCLGSAQHLKSKFGQGYQVEMKIKNVDPTDADYLENVKKIAQSCGITLPSLEKEPVAEQAEAVEEGAATTPKPPSSLEDIFVNFEQAWQALHVISGDEYLVSKVNEADPVGYLVFKEAKSPTGIDIDALAVFATSEMRMRKLNDFISGTYPASVLRERQDTKARYEVSSKGVRIGGIFQAVEENKESLNVNEYGVSQTSLEQVFNMHAEEAQRTVDQRTLDSGENTPNEDPCSQFLRLRSILSLCGLLASNF
jgi:ATP-binding cassette, subfamily A (ABC1), member 3